MAPTVQPPLFSFISDQSLALLLPIVVYWTYSLLFHWISLQEFSWFEKYRIHTKEEETRNRVELPDVIKAVVTQQLLQTALGFLAVLADDSEMTFDDELALAGYETRVIQLLSFFGLQKIVSLSAVAIIAHVCYYYLESVARFTVAMAILDTWQYFLHRLFHAVPIFYRHFHSRHHRLYVTYAFGALYNHPFEGFLMDSVGAGLAFLISGMGNRGALAFFSFSTLKTLDDHCGYNLPFNPLQLIFSNNADYHDIHHQHFGIKSNYSQPFGTTWDRILGTHMSREEANEIIRKRNERRAAQVASVAAGSIMSIATTSSSKAPHAHHKDQDVLSGGNNGGNDCHEESEHKAYAFRLHERRPGNLERHSTGSCLVDREGMLTRSRSRLGNDLISSEGLGKAL
ncbi:hypothetical protein BGZ98_000877 [Dissophora globulifera]|nr:hypothetical protein BGZ98_000877 [Dissophora globulifera]